MELNKENIEQILSAIDDVRGVTVRDGGKITILLDAANNKTEIIKREILKILSLEFGDEIHINFLTTAEKTDDAKPVKQANWNHEKIENIGKVIAIASGKGGVGKSTIAINLAAALKEAGYKVGVLDADIYGPSIAHMLGIKEKPAVVEGKIQAPEKYGIKCMSMGFLVPEGEAIIWRGPMISKTINQFLRQTEWGKLDFLLVDMPPGTGDVHISMIQQIPLDGVIIVTQPSELSLIDAERAVNMFEKLGVSILGVVENMSYLKIFFGRKKRIFGKGAGYMLSMRSGFNHFYEVPVLPNLSFQPGRPVPEAIKRITKVITG